MLWLYLLVKIKTSVSGCPQGAYIDIERQVDRKVTFIRSDRGGEYYGRHDESGN